ncbi:hypothetical protein A7K94_0206600 [Modestobacter sp. VKM Ac-2676]|nr:hypothetical protein A7K94_0206600 [Modestobacter sp. VKM Ac-2676]
MAIGVGASLLVGCGGSDEPTAGEAAGGAGASVEEVTFLNVVPIESLSFAPEMVAVCAGFFEDNGLDVTFEPTQGSAQAINTVIAGGALLTRAGDIEMISALAERDAPLRNLGDVEKSGAIRIMSAAGDPLEEPADFEDTLIGLPSVGGTSEKTLDLMLSANGIPSESVRREVTGLAPGVFDLVESGRIDGYLVSLDTALILEAQRDAVAMNPTEFMPAGNQLYVSSVEQIEDPETADQLRRYIAAIAESIRYIADDEAEGFQTMMDCIAEDFEVPALEDTESAAASMEIYVDSWTQGGDDELLVTDVDRWTSTYEAMVDAGMAPAGADPSAWVTDEFAPQS